MLVPRAYRELLGAPHATRLASSGLVARLALGATGLAVLLTVRHSTGSFAAAGGASAAYAAAVGISAPLLGRLVDRLGQARVLVPSAVGFAAATAALAGAALLAAPVWALVLASAAAGLALPPVSPCLRGVWRDVLGRGAALETAFAFEGAVVELSFVAGPLLVAALAAFLAPFAGLLLAGGATLAGTLALAGAAPVRDWHGGERQPGRAGALAAAGVRTIALTAAGIGVSFGAVEVSMPALAAQTGRAAAGGIPLASWALGSLAGGVLYGSRAWRAPLRDRYVAAAFLVAAGTAPVAAAPSVPAATALALLAGVAITPVIASGYSVVEAVAPPGALTEAFSWITTALTGGVAAGTALAGVLVERTGPHWTILGGAACALAGALYALARRRTLGPGYSISSASVGA